MINMLPLSKEDNYLLSPNIFIEHSKHFRKFSKAGGWVLLDLAFVSIIIDN